MLQYIVSMRIIPSLLRLLLVASLLLNGVGLPMQAHGSDLQHSQALTEHPAAHGLAPDNSSQEPPCHGEAAALKSSASPDVAVLPALQDPQHDESSLDCCDNGGCDGVCMQSTCAVLTGKACIAGPLHLAARAHSIPAGAPTPALPHPIRPPIG